MSGYDLEGAAPGVTRRRLLGGLAGLGLGASASYLAEPAHAATGLPSVDEVWDWQQRLVEFGTRYTGSQGHDRFVEWLAARFEAIPGLRLHRDRLTFHRWLARDHGLSISQPATIGRLRSGPRDLLLPVLGDHAGERRHREARGPGHLHAGGAGHVRHRIHARVLGAGQGRDRAGAGAAVHVLPGLRADRDGRLHAGEDLGRGGCGVRTAAGRGHQPRVPGDLRRRSAPRCPERRRAWGGLRVDRHAGRGGGQPVQPVHHAVPVTVGQADTGRSGMPGTVGRGPHRTQASGECPQRAGAGDPHVDRRDHRPRGHRDRVGGAEGEWLDG